jgi:hypothetical protein
VAVADPVVDSPLTTADKLALCLHAAAGTPFNWQRWNCAHFAAAWVLVATGRRIDLGMVAADNPRAWTAALTAAGGMRRHTSAQLGAPARPACLALPGDVVMLPGRLMPAALGVCVGERIACVGSPAGVAWQPIAVATASWSLADIGGAA